MNQVIPAPPYTQAYTNIPPPIRIKQLNVPFIRQIVVQEVIAKILCLHPCPQLYRLLLLRQVTMMNQQSPKTRLDQEMRMDIRIYFGYLKINST